MAHKNNHIHSLKEQWLELEVLEEDLDEKREEYKRVVHKEETLCSSGQFESFAIFFEST